MSPYAEGAPLERRALVSDRLSQALIKVQSRHSPAATQALRGAHHEIAVRYEWDDRQRRKALKRRGKAPLKVLRLAELRKRANDRYGRCIPPAGIALLDAIAEHLVFELTDKKRISCLHQLVEQSAPWMGTDERERFVDRWKGSRKPKLPSAGTLGKAIGLLWEDRQRLGICTIRACDRSKRWQTMRRKLEAKKRAERGRRAKGAKPRSESAARTQPWKDLGIGKTTYYARLKKEKANPDREPERTSSCALFSSRREEPYHEHEIVQPCDMARPEEGQRAERGSSRRAAPSPPVHEHGASSLPTGAFEPGDGIPFMITSRMKAELANLGYDPGEIADMTPAEAHSILKTATAARAPIPTDGALREGVRLIRMPLKSDGRWDPADIVAFITLHNRYPTRDECPAIYAPSYRAGTERRAAL